MKSPKTAFLIALVFLFSLIGQFVPLLLTIGMSVAFMGFPLPYAIERQADNVGMGDGPYSTTSFSAIPAVIDVAFVVFVIGFIWLWHRERSFSRRATFMKELVGVAALGILGMAAVYYLWQDQLWNELEFGDDPCYARIESKASTYFIRDKFVCVLRDGNGSPVGVSYYGTLDGADAATFTDFGDGCGKDAEHVYCGAEVQSFLNAEKFHEIGKGYAADDRFVTYYGRLVPDADLVSFNVLPGNYFAKDARRVYRNGTAFEGADSASFTIISDDYELSKDKGRVYYADHVIASADPATFIHIGKRFARDKQHVYCSGEPLIELDVRSYEQVGTSDYLRDVDSLYYCGELVTGVEPSSFMVKPAVKEDRTGHVTSVWTDSCGTDGKVVVCDGKVRANENPVEFFYLTEEKKKAINEFQILWK